MLLYVTCMMLYVTCRMCCAVAAPATQIVTHLCYSDFQDIMQAIDEMDGEGWIV